MNLEKLLFFFLGISLLLPWNTLINANDYYKGRFCNSEYSKSFESLFGISYNGTVLIASMIVLAVQARFTDYQLIVSGFCILSFVLSFYTLMALVDEISPSHFMIMALFSTVMSGLSSSVLGAGIGRKAANAGDLYISFMLSGQGCSGFAISLLGVVSSYSDHDEDNSGSCETDPDVNFKTFIQFFVVTVELFIVFGAYMWYEHRSLPATVPKTTNQIDEHVSEPLLETINIEAVQKGIYSEMKVNIIKLQSVWQSLLSLTVCFLVTLALYPSLTSLVVSTGSATRDTSILVAWLFLTFNTADFIGRSLTGFYFFSSQNSVLWVSLLRLLFVPAFLSLNYATDEKNPGLLSSDFDAIMLHVLLGISNGFLTSNANIQAPKQMQTEQDKDLAATAALLSLSFGLIFGSLLSYPLSSIV